METNVPVEPIQKAPKTFMSKVRKFILFLIILGLVVYTAYAAIVYFFTFSDGWRSGTLTKFSRKGFIFKTYEGEVYQRSADDISTNIINKQWTFSCQNNNPKLIEKMEANSGKELRLHYKERMTEMFWLGDSRYFVDSIVVVNP